MFLIQEAYVNALDVLLSYKRSFEAAVNGSQQVIPADDIKSIFYMINELFELVAMLLSTHC